MRFLCCAPTVGRDFVWRLVDVRGCYSVTRVSHKFSHIFRMNYKLKPPSYAQSIYGIQFHGCKNTLNATERQINNYAFPSSRYFCATSRASPTLSMLRPTPCAPSSFPPAYYHFSLVQKLDRRKPTFPPRTSVTRAAHVRASRPFDLNDSGTWLTWMTLPPSESTLKTYTALPSFFA